MTRTPRPSLVRRSRRAARRAGAATAALTSSVRMRPDFLIVGAQRSGTTSMFKTLAQHPMVARPLLVKGVHYFDVGHDQGMRWYRGHFPVEATSRFWRRGRRPLTGESSPYYMFHPLAGRRIAAELPEARLIVMLRDPVERAYSGHSHEVGRGFEDLGFEDAVSAEPKRLAGERERLLRDPGYHSEHWQHHAHVTRGQYVEQLRALEAEVGRDRILVVDSADFFAEPEPVFAQVCAFLELEPAQGISFDRHNARSRQQPLGADLRRRLEDHYAPFDAELADWWGRDPSWRRA